MPRTLTYSVLNVFAERPLEGNALAVFHDARALSDEEMQAINITRDDFHGEWNYTIHPINPSDRTVDS